MNSVLNLLPILKKDYPDIKFKSGENFSWSPKDKIIFYTTHHIKAEQGVWSLLHELAHATLGHIEYDNDFDLLKLESNTWQRACQIGNHYNIKIDDDHIQDCLDTYRDWLYKRSKCPKCGVVSLQRKDHIYQCFNCKTTWRVPRSPQHRITRRVLTD